MLIIFSSLVSLALSITHWVFSYLLLEQHLNLLLLLRREIMSIGNQLVELFLGNNNLIFSILVLILAFFNIWSVLVLFLLVVLILLFLSKHFILLRHHLVISKWTLVLLLLLAWFVLLLLEHDFLWFAFLLFRWHLINLLSIDHIVVTGIVLIVFIGELRESLIFTSKNLIHVLITSFRHLAIALRVNAKGLRVF